MNPIILIRQIFCTSIALLLGGQISALSKAEQRAGSAGHSSRKAVLTKEQAITYAIELVNRDRAKFGIKPVSIDPVATVAGQKHADEMATYGYLSHWDLAGKKPIQRYSDFGGTDYASENVGLTTIHSPKTLASKAIFQLRSDHRFSSTDLEELEDEFINEKPPNDGHRQQILNSFHNKLGVGISFSELNGQSRISIAQEFVNHYGEFEKIPSALQRKMSFVVSGLLAEQIIIDEVVIEKEPSPQTQTPAQLDSGPQISKYAGLPILEYFAGKDSELKLSKEHGRTKFSVPVQVGDDWEPGLYYVLIWAKMNRGKSRVLISARTAQLD